MPTSEQCAGNSSTLVFDHYDPKDEKRREALMALGNGLLLVRAAAPGIGTEACHYPGTYFAGCYNALPSQIQGKTVWEESIVNLPNWLPLDFSIEDCEPFSLDHVEILDYRHELDLERGLMSRSVLARDESGRKTLVREERLVSMADPNLAVYTYSITPKNWSGALYVCAAINGGVANEGVERYSDYSKRHLTNLAFSAGDNDTVFAHCRTENSGLHVAVGTRLRIQGKNPKITLAQDGERIVQNFRISAELGHPVTIEKLAAIVVLDSNDPHCPEAAVARFLQRGSNYSTMCEEHIAAWKRLWSCCLVWAMEDHLARPIRFHMFHLLQTYSPHSQGRDLGFPARGWQEAYRGQVFWDELFALPFYNLHFPQLARELLLYRHRRLQSAREAARAKGLKGALYPWRSSLHGEEATPEFQKNPQTGNWHQDHTDLQVHIGAAIAFNIVSYCSAAGDQDFLAHEGVEMLVEIARLWASLVRWDAAEERCDIAGVVGPDEYHTRYPNAAQPGLRNNAYTNIMVVWTLCRTLEVIAALPADARGRLADELSLSQSELVHWDKISRRMRIVFFDDGLVSQFAGVEALQEIDLASLRTGSVDWTLETQGKNVNAYQVFKQADFAMVIYLLRKEDLAALFQRLGYNVERDQLGRSLDYYMQRTSHGSSLSEVGFAGAFADFDPEASWDCFQKSLRLELNPAYSQSSSEGIHLGAMAGTLDVLQRRYLGLLIEPDQLSIEPALLDKLCPLRLGFHCRHGNFELAWNGTEFSIAASDGNPVPVLVSQWTRISPLAPGTTLILQCSLPDGRASGAMN